MAFVHRLFLSLLILLMVLHPGAANYAPHKSQEADVKADGLQKSVAAKYMHNPTVLPKSGKKNVQAGESSQADPKHSEMAGETTKQVPNATKHIKTIFCSGTGCMIGMVIAVVAVPAGILICSLAICWWCGRKRRLSGDQQERTHLIPQSDNQSSSPEPAMPPQ